MENIEILYKKCRGILNKLAFKYSETSVFEFNDLLSDGNEIFMKCYKSFDKNKGSKFSTWFYLCLKNHYLYKIRTSKSVKSIDKYTTKTIDCCLSNLEFVNSRGITKDSKASLFIPVDKKNIERDVSKKDSFKKLSIEAKEIIEIILNGPKEVIEMITSPITKKFQKREVNTFIRNKFGRTNGSKTIKELKNFVNIL